MIVQQEANANRLRVTICGLRRRSVQQRELTDMNRLIAVPLAVILVSWHGNAIAQDYPSRSVRIIMPYPAGGATDIVGRLVAQHLSAAVGQPVIVDNRPGASALLGTEAAAKAPPDGYTLLMATSTNAINQTLHISWRR